MNTEEYSGHPLTVFSIGGECVFEYYENNSFKKNTCQWRGYIYLREDDSHFSSVTLFYEDKHGNVISLKDDNYPFGYTIPIKGLEGGVSLWFSAINLRGNVEKSEKYTLHGN